jgi:hypothetical protein
MTDKTLWHSLNGDLKYYNSIEDFEEGTIGFVYKITHIPSKKSYIGKKNLYTERNVKLGVKELKNLPITRGRTPSKKKVIAESNWKIYYGSNKEFTDFVKLYPKEEFKREILHICKSKKELTYYEMRYQFVNDVLLDPLSFNSNVAGKFFRKDLETDE